LETVFLLVSNTKDFFKTIYHKKTRIMNQRLRWCQRALFALLCLPAIAFTQQQVPVSDIDHAGMGTFSGSYKQIACDKIWIVFNANAGGVVTFKLLFPTSIRVSVVLYQAPDGCVQIGDNSADGTLTLMGQFTLNGNGSFATMSTTTAGQYAFQVEYPGTVSIPYTFELFGSTATTVLCGNTTSIDTDGDRIPNSCDDDDDGDNVLDADDCAPLDATKWRTGNFYVDGDGDGYGTGTSAPLCYGTNTPTGYSTVGGDCNDNLNAGGAAINPGATEVCDGIDNNCNGVVDEGFAHTDDDALADCVDPDDDNDNVLDGDDCAPLDATKWRTGNFYADVDGDGYGAGAPVSLCYGTNTPGGYSTVGGDCVDNNPSIKPGAVEICGNSIDDNCNGLIDENCTAVCQDAAGFTTTLITATRAQLNWTGTDNPLQWQVQYKTTKQGSKWVDVLVSGDKRSVIISSLVAAQDYMWHIRAKCGTTWTEYSGSQKFKTLQVSEAVVTRSIASKPSVTVDETAGEITVQNYPNPFSKLTTIRYTLPAETEVSLVVYDHLGRKITQLAQGRMSAGEHGAQFDATRLAPGTYLYMLRAADSKGKPVVLSGKLVVVK
jgi:hypothetical protein